MADYTATTNLTLEQCITNGPMTNGDNLTINNGAVVTMTQTNSVLIGNIAINEGEFFIDGTNISSGNVISFVQDWGRNTTAYGQGKYKTTGDWYDLGTTDGTNAQTFNLSTFYGGNFECVVNGIWVETGRRINFDGSSGTTPAVDDWVYKTSDIDVLGRIVGVQSTYVVVQYLTGTLANNDEIEIRKVVTNTNGPDYEISWTADVNHASGDIAEDGIYQEFGNTVYNKTSYTADFGHTISGFVFAHIPESTTLTMGSATGGGFVPPTGCNVRIPNINWTSSNTTNFPGGTIYNAGGSDPSLRPEARTTGGIIEWNIFNVGNAYFRTGNAYTYDMYYVASNTACGGYETASDVVIQHNIGTADPWGTSSPSYYYFATYDMLQSVEISDSLLVMGFSRYGGYAVYSSSDILIKNNIFTCSKNITASVSAYRYSRCSDLTIDNCICCANESTGGLGKQNLYIDQSSDVEVTNFKMMAKQDGTVGGSETQHINLNYINNAMIKGIEILEESCGGDALIGITDCDGVKIRCMGMIDDKVATNSSDFESLVYFSGYCRNIDIARLWIDSTIARTYGAVSLTNTSKSVTVQNCSGPYATLFSPVGADTILLKGVHGGSGTPGSTNGINESYSSCYGWAIHDGFRSDTVGYIVALMIPDTTATNSSITITAGNPLFMKDGSLDMVSGDVVEIAQSYFSKGHISFPGTYTSTIGTSTWNANEWTNVTLDFQYDIGSGWSGSWLDVRTASNWTGITIVAATGVKLKFRLTATGTQSDMRMLIIDTVTSIAVQKANQYPIDQVSCDVILNGIVVDSRWWIYDSDTDTELAEGTASADPVTQNVVVPDATNLLIRVRKSSASVKYKPLITTAITNTTEINVAIIQQADGIAT